MSNILKNIFDPINDNVTRCEVVRRVSVGKYEVRDSIGRMLIVNSDVSYHPGSFVNVQFSRIVSRSAEATTIKTYSV